MTLEEEVIQMREENQLLRERVALLEQQIEELEKGQRSPPLPFAKPNKRTREGEKGPRRKRAAEHSHGS